MEEKTWQQIYLYGKEHETFLRSFIEKKKDSGLPLTVADFHSIDIIRPSKNEIVSEFIDRNRLGSNLNILDVGCGLAGMCRYLANLGNNLTGCDILSHYIDIGNEINSLVGLAEKIKLVNGNILEVDLPTNSFDLITCLGVMLYLPGPEVLLKLSSLLKPGGVLFIEDYILLKSSPNEEELNLLHTFNCIPFKTRAVYDSQLNSSGLSVFEFCDKSHQTSIFAWNRAEIILDKLKNGENLRDAEVLIYGVVCPQILNNVGELGPEELMKRFPNVCERIGLEKVLNSDVLLTWVTLAAKKE